MNRKIYNWIHGFYLIKKIYNIQKNINWYSNFFIAYSIYIALSVGSDFIHKYPKIKVKTDNAKKVEPISSYFI